MAALPPEADETEIGVDWGPQAGVQNAGPQSLLAADDDLESAVAPDERAAARKLLQGAAFEVGKGPFDLSEQAVPATTFALLLTAGKLFKEVHCQGRILAELLVPGDLLLTWSPAGDGLDAERRFVALEPARLIGLDRRFMYAAARWPGLMVELNRRLSEQEQRVAVHGAICQLPRVEDRILAVLGHLAVRIGRVGPRGTRIPLSLTHAALGELVGARRSTVTLAIGGLMAAGRIERLPDGHWVVRQPEEHPPA